MSVYALFGRLETSHCVLSVQLGVAYPYPGDVLGQFSVNNFYGYGPAFYTRIQKAATFPGRQVGPVRKRKRLVLYKRKYVSD